MFARSEINTRVSPKQSPIVVSTFWPSSKAGIGTPGMWYDRDRQPQMPPFSASSPPSWKPWPHSTPSWSSWVISMFTWRIWRVGTASHWTASWNRSPWFSTWNRQPTRPVVCWMSSSRVLTATSGTCASIRLPSPTMAWSRVPSRMRTQPVRLRSSAFWCGAGLGARLSPLRFYKADIQRLIVSLRFGVHLHADNTQFHGSWKPEEAADLAARAMDVINSVKTWMSSNRLRPNAEKTQFIWLGTSHFLGRRDMQAVSSILQSSDVVNNLGVYLTWGSSWIVRWANYVKFATFT